VNRRRADIDVVSRLSSYEYLQTLANTYKIRSYRSWIGGYSTCRRAWMTTNADLSPRPFAPGRPARRRLAEAVPLDVIGEREL
jgi:hypothetical protein